MFYELDCSTNSYSSDFKSHTKDFSYFKVATEALCVFIIIVLEIPAIPIVHSLQDVYYTYGIICYTSLPWAEAGVH